MWKYVTRGIRESFERRASCRTNVYSQPPQENGKSEVKSNLACNRSFLSPTLVDCKNGFCSTAKPDGAKNKQHESGWNAKHTWTEAVGWSSVLAVGWVVCQSLCLHRRLFGPDPEASWRKRISQAHDVRISHLLAQVLSLQPNHVLPITNCVGSNRGARNNDSVEPQWVPNRPYGPITVEEVRTLLCRQYAL